MSIERLRRWGQSLQVRLLVVNLIVVLVPVAGLEFARLFERELLRALERDMRHQAVSTRFFLESTGERELLGAATDAQAEAASSAPESAAAGASRSGFSVRQEATLRRIAASTRMRIRVLDRQGGVVLDSHRDGPPEGAEPAAPVVFPELDEVLSSVTGPSRGPLWKPIPQRPEVVAALAGQRGSYTRIRETHPSVLLFVTEPVFAQGRVMGVAYVTRSTQPVLVELYRIRNGLWKLLSIAILGSAVVTLVLAFSITRPLARLSRAARQIAHGAYNLELPVSGTGEVRELAQSFQKMTETLRQRLRDTAAFASDVAHAFKSPLTSIRGAAELLEGGVDEDPELRQRFLRNIELDADRLDRLVSRLLQLGRIEASEEPFSPVELLPLLEELRERSEVPDVAVEVSCPPGVLVPGRRSDLGTALANLLDNAVKASPPGSAVQVQAILEARPVGSSLQCTTNGSSQFRRQEDTKPRHGISIRVMDSGPGIAPALHTRVFERFFTTDSEQGTGLGLAITQAVIEAHAGELSLDASCGPGACFVVWLPVMPRDAHPLRKA